MKLVFAIFVIGVSLPIVTEAFPSSKEYELQPGIPTSLLEVENQQLSQATASEDQNPLAREKRHKKKVVIINQYYGRPGYHDYGQGCRGCGGYGYGYPNYGYGYQGGYPYGGYQGGYNEGYGGHGHKKFKG